MAKHLHAIQSGVNPGGLLAVIECRTGSRPAFAILKLEREEGVRLEPSKVHGKRTFNLGHLHDLILTEKTKLYKIGVFVLDGDKQLQGTVCDQQRGFMPRTEIASFFLSEFLGCRLRDDPTVSTKHFYEAGEDFINKSVADPLDRVTYHRHILSELTSNRTVINPNDFANTYLKPEDRQPFLTHLSDNKVPAGPFPKNNVLIAPRLKTTIMEFQSGIQVAGPQEVMKEKVSLEKTDEETVRATITDKLKKIRNR
jgi:hypothetical protein